MHRQIAGALTGRVTKWIVAVAAIAVFAVCSPFFSKITDVEDNQASSWLPGSAESTRALDQISAFQDENDLGTTVVYSKPDGFTASDRAAIADQARQFASIEGVTGKVTPPQYSSDGQAAQTVLTFNFGTDGWNKIPDAADQLRDIAHVPGAQTYVAGYGGQAADSATIFNGAGGTLLLFTVLIVVVILLITYRSPVLWLLPILSSMVALAAANAVVYVLAKYAGLTVNGQSSFILTVLVIGAGTDYALLLVARYREELRRHQNRHEAMAVALHRASPAIIASASTVAIGMLCLMLAQMNSTAGLGPVMAVGIVVTLLVMITVLPALLVICGRWVFWPFAPGYRSAEPTTSGVWARVGRFIAPRARRVWLGTAVVLGVACLGLFSLSASGLGLDHTFTKQADSVTGQHVLEDHQLADTSNAALVVTDPAHADQVARAMSGIDGLEPPTRPVVSDDNALVSATMDGDAASPASFDTVVALRTSVHAVPGADALVGGNAAINYDIQQASQRDDLVVTPAVLVVVLLVLMLLLRALVSPLVLIATVVLSFGAALGIASLIFTQLLGYPTTDAGFPLFAFVFLVALGIDYNIFLMTRVREEAQVRGTREGSLVALGATGGVITSAGVVLAATFAVLGTLPLVFTREVGIAVALGVLLDTLVVRSVLVTALNLDLGSRIWWPSRLDRGPAPRDTVSSGEGEQAPTRA